MVYLGDQHVRTVFRIHRVAVSSTDSKIKLSFKLTATRSLTLSLIVAEKSKVCRSGEVFQMNTMNNLKRIIDLRNESLTALLKRVETRLALM